MSNLRVEERNVVDSSRLQANNIYYVYVDENLHIFVFK